MVARVDAIFKTDPALGDLVGRELTIELAAELPTLDIGAQAIFHAIEWIYGDEIAVKEVARLPATDRSETEVKAAIEALPLRRLELRLRGADLVVDGVVERIEPSPLQEPLSFNAPASKVAVIGIETALKGKPGRSRQLKLLFPSSDDWAPAPQFTEGQEGIFLLRHEPELGIPVEFLTALDPADYQPRAALAEVRRLVSAR